MGGSDVAEAITVALRLTQGTVKLPHSVTGKPEHSRHPHCLTR